MSDLTWQHTWPDEPGPDFILVRARAGEPELIGRVMRQRRSQVAEISMGWSWSLTSAVRIVGIRHPGYLTSGFEATQRGARNALVAAWRAEEAFRANVRESEAFAGLGPYLQDYLVNGKPEPPQRLPDKPDPA